MKKGLLFFLATIMMFALFNAGVFAVGTNDTETDIHDPNEDKIFESIEKTDKSDDIISEKELIKNSDDSFKNDSVSKSVIDAGMNIEASTSENRILISWSIAEPQNLTAGFKVLASATNLEPLYPQKGTAYHYFSDNTKRSDFFNDLKADTKYYFRIGQYHTDGKVYFYSPVVSLITPKQEKKDDNLKMEGDKSTKKNDVKNTKDEDYKRNLKIESTGFFKDINSHWSKNNILKLKEKCGIMGYKDEKGNILYEFRPDEKISRAELAKMLVDCHGENINKSKNAFKDVQKGSWYEDSVLKVHEKGWAEGYSDGSFKPHQFATRAEALKMILLSKHDKVNTKAQKAFTDIEKNAWYYPYVLFAVSERIVQGYSDNTFRPNQIITRAEAAKIIVSVKELAN